MTPGMQFVMEALVGKRFPLEDEKATQAAMWRALQDATARATRPWPIAREACITGGIIDFLVGTTGIEVKIKGQRAGIIRQLKCYAAEPFLSGLVLVTSKPVNVGPRLLDKPVAVFDLARAWL